MSLSHIDASGQSHMVDVSAKGVTTRIARACASVYFPDEVFEFIQKSHGKTAKGTITEVARIAAIMACKNTAALIPLCHPMMIESCDIDFQYDSETYALHIEASVRVTHKTGVEMEALTAASVAALTVYDMTKALSHDITIGDIQLLHKSGGRHDYER